jgi:lysophospholipase L1-like esterase
MEERLPPACAFAISVLAEHEQDPEAVPEEAVEAAQQHMATCARCQNASNTRTIPTAAPAPRKKKRTRRPAENNGTGQSSVQTLVDETPPPPNDKDTSGELQTPPPSQTPPQEPGHTERALQTTTRASFAVEPQEITDIVYDGGIIDCQQCRQLLPEYVDALDQGQNAAVLYPEVHMHLLACDSGCLVLLDMLKQEAKAARKYRRKPVRDPFSAIWWELTGFFRGGQVPMSPMALAYGTLILLILAASCSAYLGFSWDEARHSVHPHFIPTPDGIGLSDGLKVYDACNSNSYQNKRAAAQAMQSHNFAKADSLLAAATNVLQSDTTGCNGAEAAIYREDLHIRQSGRPYSIVVVSFDSGPGNADPQGGTDRHILYAAYTQELVGTYIAQEQYNQTQMQTPGAPLLYLVLANTTGVESGALQIANTVAAMASSTNMGQFGLLATGAHPLMGVLGLGPSSLAQIVLPVLCRAGVPLIAPTATGEFIINLLSQTSLYRHCTAGFAFIRFSPDDTAQSSMAASYAYHQLHVRHAAIFYDPSNPASAETAQGFSDSFSGNGGASIVARETAVASGLLDANGRPQASRADLLAGLNDALQAKPRPDLIFAPLLTNDITTLGQAIAQLPQNQQPILMIGGEFVQPAALQGLVQWARQQQLTLPRIFVAQSSAARPPTNEDWQKQFYASFCTSFATPGSFCSGAAALDQGALLFGDGIEVITRGIGPITDSSKLPTTEQLVKNISAEKFAGISSPIDLDLHDNVLVTSTRVLPVILGIQQDGSIQIVE